LRHGDGVVRHGKREKVFCSHVSVLLTGRSFICSTCTAKAGFSYVLKEFGVATLHLLVQYVHRGFFRSKGDHVGVLQCSIPSFEARILIFSYVAASVCLLPDGLLAARGVHVLRTSDKTLEPPNEPQYFMCVNTTSPCT